MHDQEDICIPFKQFGLDGSSRQHNFTSLITYMTCIQEFKTITARHRQSDFRYQVIGIRTIISYIYTQTIMEKAEISSKFQRTVTFRQKLIII